ncbi:dihydropteroate synthase [Sandaracinobacteroides saxicola]|uniref:Dihydropteroate synthase n=1 Tax=Sandaracinobacteroides saxicola TaxID=2759707 RepID=A0A7G5IF93_9SPHN|nr:dihydropteroate synthase [Sandaracinobacteroides saxicola]QMW22035.1 dihydropteroate synthase [Sandaracinobacteroides saxicola]
MKPHIMGILNVTPDSFSDGGRLGSVEEAVVAARAMRAAGAAIIDVGGESTRPGAAPVAVAEELRRTIPVVAALVAEGIPVSIDTRKAAVMRAALAAGATMLNDVSALTHDRESLAVAAASDAAIVLMHHQGTPETMQRAPAYADPLAEVIEWLRARVAACEAAGIDRARLIVDPGIGFGKGLAHNLALLRGLDRIAVETGCPLLLGASRKSLIPAIAGAAPVSDRLPGSLALALHGATKAAAWLRVHDVAETAQALAVWRALNGPAAEPPPRRAAPPPA